MTDFTATSRDAKIGAMAARGRIRRRLAVAIVLTALIPLLGAIVLARSMVRTTAGRFYRPEIGARLDEALELYRELARVHKESLRHQADAIARSTVLDDAPVGERRRLDASLRRTLGAYPALVSVDVETADGRALGHADRGRPLDEAHEFGLDVERPVGLDQEGTVRMVFATPRRTFDRLDSMSEFVNTYEKVVAGRDEDEQTYVLAFAALLGVAIALAILVGTGVASNVSRRITAFAGAARRAGSGDLTIRVEESGKDELAELGEAFNQMLVEIQSSRARIEYLQRISAWQEMARRLAHEIKNPLTPIQLAVEEVHQRYDGPDASFRRTLDDTLEVVQAEVGTLRRLVGEFSDFARLPEATLEEADLASLLAEHRTAAEYEPLLSRRDEDAKRPSVDVVFDLPMASAPAYLDRQMMRRVLDNLLRNAIQAIIDSGRVAGRVGVSLGREGSYWTVDVDDDGPGIPVELRDRIFDPYVTTKTEGTGLGLAIVKKIVVEHGGAITATTSPLGGARLRLEVPVAGTPEGLAALSRRTSRVEVTAGEPSMVLPA